MEEWEYYADGVVVVDKDFKIISFNPGAERILGFTFSQIKGKGCSQVLGEEFYKLVSQTISKGDVLTGIRVKVRREENEELFLSVTTSPLKDFKGNIVGVVAVLRNPLEVPSLISALEEERNRLEAILQSINDGVFTVDTQWRITCFNKAAERITGYRREEALGKRCYEIFRSNLCKTDCPLRKTIQTHRPLSGVEMQIVNKEGRRVPISVSTSLLIDREGEIMGGVEVFRDLTLMKSLKKELEERYSFGNLVGKSEKMQKIYDLLEVVSDTDSNVLIVGETGTGKKLVARALHYNSSRREYPFVTISCAAIPENLLESELFGHEKGAFTGAVERKLGKFEVANGGTIFLDEIEELPKPLQAKVLRVIEDKEFERVGGTETIKVDVRIVAATNRNLKELVEEGKFREDLYYRLKVVTIVLPPLRERREDIPLLVEHFIKHFNRKMERNIKGLSRSAMDIILDYDWPGNVRELENAIEHAFIHCRGEIIQPAHLPEEIVESKKVLGEEKKIRNIKEIEKGIIQTALKEGKRRKEIAEILGVSRSTLWRKMKKYGIASQENSSGR